VIVPSFARRTQSGARSTFFRAGVKRVDCGTKTRGPVMSFWNALFGGSAGKAEKLAEPVEYKGYVIQAEPFKQAGQFQTAGIIEREIDGVRKEHRFIRADAFASYDDAVAFTLSKARQMIDLQGARMFGSSET
jgi:hypothetical protein